jgi:uncharacterized protein (TIRG00374 family)
VSDPSRPAPTGTAVATAPGGRLRRRRRWVQVATSLVLTAAVVEYAVLPQLVKARADVSLATGGAVWLLAVAVVLEAASLASYTALTQATVPVPHRLRWRTQLAMDLTGFAASHSLPGGGATAAALRYRLMTARRVPPRIALSTAAVQTTFSDLALLGTYCLGVALSLPETRDHPAYVIAAGVGVVVMVTTGTASWLLARHRPATHVVATVEPFRSPRLRRWARRLRRLADEIVTFLGDHDRRNSAVLYAVGNWVLDAAALWACVAAYGKVLSPGLLLTAYGAAGLLGLLPLTPGGLGVIEGALIPSLLAFGVGGSAAVLGVISWRIVQFWIPIPVGGVAYVALRVGDARTGRALPRR